MPDRLTIRPKKTWVFCNTDKDQTGAQAHGASSGKPAPAGAGAGAGVRLVPHYHYYTGVTELTHETRPGARSPADEITWTSDSMPGPSTIV